MVERVLGGVLVGGRSRRMGRPKALVEIRGEALGAKVAGALAEAVHPVVLIGSGPVPVQVAGLRRLEDAEGVAGPLGGLLAALRAEPGAAWMIASCDLPRVRGDAVRWLLRQRRDGRAAILPRAGAGHPPEPLFALYEPEALPRLEALAAAGRWGPRHLAAGEGVASPVVPSDLADAWRDLDTPEELAEELAEAGDPPLAGPGSAGGEGSGRP